MQEHNYAISAIRFISMLMIVACHVFQYLNNELAWWLNVGVQVFLCISGYLYGSRIIGPDIADYYKKRFRRILVPAYIVLIPLVVCYNWLSTEPLSVVNTARVLLLNRTFDGAGHLWYVPMILMCYAITPIIQSFFIKCNTSKNLLATTTVSLLICTIVCLGFATFYHPAWIGCYILGYALGYNDSRCLINTKYLILLFGILSLMNLLQIVLDYVVCYEAKGSIIYSGWKAYNHVFLGCLLFLAFKSLLSTVEFRQEWLKVLHLSDKYSYEVYLIHLPLIKGPLSLMAMSDNLPLNLAVITVMILAGVFVLKRLEAIVESFI